MRLTSFLHAAAASLSVAAVPALAVSYSALPITAKVVDAQTGQPLSGANVVVSWGVVSVTGRSAGIMALDEALTDADGSFHIAGWGPKAISSQLPRGSRMVGDSPEILVFKSGYKLVAFHNYNTPDRIKDPSYTGAPVRGSDWDGKTLRLEKFQGTLETYGFSIGGLVGPVHAGGSVECPWLKLPHAYRTLRLEKVRLVAAGVRNDLPDERYLAWLNTPCSPAEVKRFLEEYER